MFDSFQNEYQLKLSFIFCSQHKIDLNYLIQYTFSKVQVVDFTLIEVTIRDRFGFGVEIPRLK